MTEGAPAVRRDPTWVATWVLWILAVTTVTWLVAINVLRLGPAFLLPLVFASTAFCVLACVWFSPQPLAPRTAIVPAIMGLLAGLAPVALVLLFRLSVTMCTVVDIFGLPWAEPFRSAMHAASAVVWLASSVLLVIGVAVDRGLRRPAIAMLVWSAYATVPAFLLFFITVYGDPAPGCVPS